LPNFIDGGSNPEYLPNRQTKAVEILGSIRVNNLDQGTKSEMTGEIPNMIKGAQVYGLKRIAAGKK
jgi:hypothetical protein